MTPPKKAIVLQHAPHEGPGRVQGALERAGFSVEVRQLFANSRVPYPEDFDLLVVMGGPMGVGDVEDPSYPFLKPEVLLLKECLSQQKPVLGICLGAQLLAHAAGARVFAMSTEEERRPIREVGWGAVHLVANGASATIFEGSHAAEVVLHWHGDTFELPEGAELLASSLTCEHQMFRLGNTFGLQFHIEVDSEDVERWLDEDAEYVKGALGPSGAARIRRDTERFMPAFRTFGDRWLDAIIGELSAC
ncbi:MAG: gamma-glutamyl-gamma-aminobutyrate hydrolase family protein [Polyangiaceae bacterium]|nr:gamma-glutamyl-gamma-aminobutyrate hydrolase family protein [Polyangiaceae bacterium]